MVVLCMWQSRKEDTQPREDSSLQRPNISWTNKANRGRSAEGVFEVHSVTRWVLLHPAVQVGVGGKEEAPP